MERLTDKMLTKACNDPWDYCGLDAHCTRHCTQPTPCKIPALVHRLAKIEDILGDNYDLDRLREQVERMRGEWVAKHRHRGGFRRVTGVDDMGEQRTITIDERCEYDDRYCSRCGKQSPDNFLNFCGYCGAPMTDEAVDMVMERISEMEEMTNEH